MLLRLLTSNQFPDASRDIREVKPEPIVPVYHPKVVELATNILVQVIYKLHPDSCISVNLTYSLRYQSQ